MTVDKAAVMRNNVVGKDHRDRIVDEMQWTISKRNLYKNDLITLDIVASNLWERPIYFAVSVSPGSHLGLNEYFQLEGLAYRVVPVKTAKVGGRYGYIANDIMIDNVMSKFKWGGIERKVNASAEQIEQLDWMSTQPQDVFLDENILRMTMNLRSNFGRLAESFLVAGDKAGAIKVLDKSLFVMPYQTVPLNVFVASYPELYYRAGNKEKARRLIEQLTYGQSQNLKYYHDILDFEGSREKAIRSASVVAEMARIVSTYDKEFQEEFALSITAVEPLMMIYRGRR